MVKENKKLKRNTSLADDIISVRTAKSSTRQKSRILNKQTMKEDDKSSMSSKMSKKLVNLAKSQQNELQKEEDSEASTSFRNVSGSIPAMDGLDVIMDSIENDKYDIPEFEASKEMEEEYEKFLSISKETRADACEKQFTAINNQLPADFNIIKMLPESNVEHFTKMGQYFSKYRSGSIPKTFKTLPTLNCWKEYLSFTKPDDWTAAAMFKITKIITKGLNGDDLIYFYVTILLPRVRDDMLEYKKINCHLYKALKLATLKPAEFFQGIVFPLIEAQDCRLSEAIKICSLINSCKMPGHIFSQVILYLCNYPLSPSLCLFIRTLLEKKTAFDLTISFKALVEFFTRPAKDEAAYTVIWHQCLLSFVRIYKQFLTVDQHKMLSKQLKVHNHHKITPEIKSELESCKDFRMEC